MKPIIDIAPLNLAIGYLLLLVPFAIILFQRIPILGKTGIALARMTVQLLFVGFYLEFLFTYNSPWLNTAWLIVMLSVADLSVLNSCGLKIKVFALPVFIAIAIGTVLPLATFIILILQTAHFFDAQYMIPIGGMVLGNCLRADIIGLRTFYTSVRDKEKEFHFSLTQGATLHEALRPFQRDALESALLPTIASMATIGLVAIPGMMTGTMMAGTHPLTAIKYQIAIMIAIFSGTAVTVFLALYITRLYCFTSYGMCKKDIWRD